MKGGKDNWPNAIHITKQFDEKQKAVFWDREGTINRHTGLLKNSAGCKTILVSEDFGRLNAVRRVAL